MLMRGQPCCSLGLTKAVWMRFLPFFQEHQHAIICIKAQICLHRHTRMEEVFFIFYSKPNLQCHLHCGRDQGSLSHFHCFSIMENVDKMPPWGDLSKPFQVLKWPPLHYHCVKVMIKWIEKKELVCHIFFGGKVSTLCQLPFEKKVFEFKSTFQIIKKVKIKSKYSFCDTILAYILGL